MATGVFDLLHPGHIFYLEQSKKLGDELVVVVANDKVVSRTKGEHLFGAESRREMVKALHCVSEVIIPSETDPRRYYRTVLAVKPDIITLGYDQPFDERELSRLLSKYGWHGKIVRIGKYRESNLSSSRLKAKIKQDDMSSES